MQSRLDKLEEKVDNMGRHAMGRNPDNLFKEDKYVSMNESDYDFNDE